MAPCPYTYEAMCSTLYSSSAPPDLIYFLEMFILPMFADLPLDTVAQMKQSLDKTLALIHLALTLQFAALEALAFEGYVAAKWEVAPAMTVSKVQRTSSRRTTTRTRPALAILAPKPSSHSSQTSLDILNESPTSRSSSYSSQTSDTTTTTQSHDDASRSSSYSSQSSLFSSIIDPYTSPPSKLSPHTSRPSALSLRRGMKPMSLTLPTSSSRHNPSTLSRSTLPSLATKTSASSVNTWCDSIITPDYALSSGLTSYIHNMPTFQTAPTITMTSTPFPSRRSSIRSSFQSSVRPPLTLLAQTKDQMQLPTAGDASLTTPIRSRPLSSKSPSQHMNTLPTSSKMLPLFQTQRDRASVSTALPLPPKSKSSRKRLAAATRHIFARKREHAAQKGMQHEKGYCYSGLVS